MDLLDFFYYALALVTIVTGISAGGFLVKRFSSYSLQVKHHCEIMAVIMTLIFIISLIFVIIYPSIKP